MICILEGNADQSILWYVLMKKDRIQLIRGGSCILKGIEEQFMKDKEKNNVPESFPL